MKKAAKPSLRGMLRSLVFYAPALLIGLWLFFTLDDAWYFRLPGAVFLGMMFQGSSMVVYYMAAAGAAELLGEDDVSVLDDVYRPHLIATLFLIASMFVLGQHWRNRATSSIEACVRDSTAPGYPFGEFESARELVYYCANEYGRDDNYDSDY